jgi:ubiquinone/menaquinone biosynthesis C-methylase UbiE
VPLGTGRFLEYFNAEQNSVYGVDISKDMLLQAESRWNKYIIKDNVGSMQIGDVFNLPFDNKSIDHIVCIRLLNWMNIDEVGLIMNEFRRVSNESIVVSIRVERKTSIADMLSIEYMRYFLQRKNIKRIAKSVYKLLRVKNRATINDTNDKSNPSLGHVHDEQTVLNIFSSLGLIVKEINTVENNFLFFKRKNRPFFIYWLSVPKLK